MFRNYISILFIYFTTTFFCWGQTPTVIIESRESINKHITYLNYCADYIGVVKITLEDYNNKINTSYYNKNIKVAKREHLPFKIENNNIPEALKWQAPKLTSFYTTLNTSRKNMDTLSAQILATAIKKYHNHYNKFLSTLKQFTLLTNNTTEFYKDSNFKEPYELLVTIEKNIEQLTLESDLLFDIVLQLFGDEELPEALERSKHIAFLYKKMIQEFRSEKKDNLPMLLAHFKRISDTQNTEKQYRILEQFGNYIITDPKQIQKRENIERQANATISIIQDYINNELTPCNTKQLESYGEYYCWLNKVNSFDDASKNTIGSYNSYANRAHTPVLLLIQELQPFKVLLPKEMMYMREDIKLATAIHPIKKINTSLTKTPFNKKDITSLHGAKDNNLVLLLDISASMRLNNNEEKLKKSIIHLIEILRPEDQLTIISYSGVPKKILDTSNDYDKEALKTTINTLKSNGNTDAIAGLKMAYKTCQGNYNKNKNNKIIIASDGGFWINNEIKQKITNASKSSIILSTFHYLSKKSDGKKILEELAKLGNGNYQLIKEESDAINTLVYESKQQ